jgi:selenocysteine-specific elongation factor
VIILGDIREKLTGRTLCVSVAGWQALSDRAKEALSGYHQQFPLRRGMPPEELKSRLSISARAFAASLPRLAAEHTIMDDSGLLRLPDHEVRFSAAQQVRIDSFFASLKLAPYTPPAREEMEAELGADVVLALVDRGRLVKVREDLLFEAGAYQAMVAGVVDRIKSSGHTNVADVRDLFDTSRKYAIALLEHLDAEHVTRREGDERVLWA